MNKKIQYWARYDVTFHSLIYDLWDALEEDIPNTYVKEEDPHVTIHPRFQFSEGREKEFEHYVYENFPQSIRLTVNGFYYYPSKNKPMVICLDIDTSIDFRKSQRELESLVSTNGGKNVLQTAPPHITVYKSKDKGGGKRNIPSNVNRIRTRCRNIGRDIFPIRVGETRLVVEKAPYN